jgi:glycosyltransferase involved in cell wall biosynthesis
VARDPTKTLVVGFDVTPAPSAPAGVTRYANDLLAALDRAPGVRMERIGMPKAMGGGLVGRFARGAARDLAMYPVLLDRQATRRGVDLIHCPGPMVPQRLTRPLVLTIHDMLPWRYPDLFSRRNIIRQRLLVARVARRAHRIVVGSDYTRREVVELLGIPESRVAVTPWGVDRRFRPIRQDPAELAHRFGIPPEPFVLAVGTAEPRKNLSALLRAFALVRRRAPECSLVLVGTQDGEGSELERELSSLGRGVILPGIVSDDDLVALYSSTACFVFPSLYEGFGFPPLEAMACGAPVVAAARTSVPEVVGDAAILVDPNDADALADGIEQVVLSDEIASDLRRRGLARSREFTWQRCAEATVAAYHAALDDRMTHP